jgi:hypothetical protein
VFVGVVVEDVEEFVGDVGAFVGWGAVPPVAL